MRLKVIAPVVRSLLLGVLMIGLAACDSKENEPVASALSSTSEASQPAAPVAPAAPAPAQAQAKINAAEFFTKADAEAVLGKTVNEPTLQGDGATMSNVSYVAADFSGVSLYVRPGASAKTFEEAQAHSKSISGADPMPVEGLGDKAYWAAGKLNQLNVLKHSNLLIVSVMGKGDQSLDLAKQAAEKILPRVP
jgi:hypothetical protein